MKLLLVPGSNSLSHVAKCAALEKILTSAGHSVLIAVAREHAGFLRRLALPHSILPDIQEADGAALPSLNWFRSPDLLQHCIKTEIDLLKSYRPDRVIGVFRFTTKVSTAVLRTAYDTLACGCMMPEMTEVLGFGSGGEKSAEQSLYLDNFFRFAARKISMVMASFGLEAVNDLRELLVGDRTLLWDFPEFMPLPKRLNRFYIGPLSWHQWSDGAPVSVPPASDGHPRALICLGTRRPDQAVVEKATRCLLACGFDVTIACGGHRQLMDRLSPTHRVQTCLFAPLDQLLPDASLIVCHGGQMTVFEALKHRVPVLVIPSQPEQAHNGFCVERIGCGRRLSDPVAFKGDPRAFVQAFNRQSDIEVMEKIVHPALNGDLTIGLAKAQHCLQHYDATRIIADLMENG
ncbi:glycosyltransferase [Desulfosarcina ovata]|uniref:glycosyltransferase n=1 Tax=Desulfosarcina ovata TaxID=83564 RepID=UPI0012D32A9D|nr:glycosyltransferase [Desulfosarcina ovata]